MADPVHDTRSTYSCTPDAGRFAPEDIPIYETGPMYICACIHLYPQNQQHILLRSSLLRFDNPYFQYKYFIEQVNRQ